MTIFGSKFPEDRSEQYSYRILSQIILCMESGRWLVLKDLDEIYGSLYDMLNQNYVVIGDKRNCRIALGAYSNPMCHVKDGFRCIVLVDSKNLDFTDPPFLNRFEKQSFTYQDLLDKQLKSQLALLTKWVEGITTGQEDFDAIDMFLGYHNETLASLVLHHSSAGDSNLLDRCKQDLIMIATADGIVRASNSVLAQTDRDEVQHWQDVYFANQIHESLFDFAQFIASADQLHNWGGVGNSTCTKTVVMTYSSIHAPITPLVEPLCSPDNTLVYKVGTFTSEKQLSNCVQSFFTSPTLVLLTLQCDSANDAPHILLTKSMVDQIMSEHKLICNKHVMLIIHIHRGMVSELSNSWQLSFGSAWQMLSIDSLERPQVPLVKMLNVSAKDLMDTGTFSLEEQINASLDWAFMCIKYPISSLEQLKSIYLVVPLSLFI
jgi:hypothetical protein